MATQGCVSSSVRVIRSGVSVGTLRQDLLSLSLQNPQNDTSVSPKKSRKRKTPMEMAAPTEAREKKPRLGPLATDPEVQGTSNFPTVVLNPSAKSVILQMSVSWDYLGVRRCVPVNVLVDTGAECSVFDIYFVERNLCRGSVGMGL